MKTRLCNKCNKRIVYPFYSIKFRYAPKRVKQKSTYSDDIYEVTKYDYLDCADLCVKCWKELKIKENPKVYDMGEIK